MTVYELQKLDHGKLMNATFPECNNSLKKNISYWHGYKLVNDCRTYVYIPDFLVDHNDRFFKPDIFHFISNLSAARLQLFNKGLRELLIESSSDLQDGPWPRQTQGAMAHLHNDDRVQLYILKASTRCLFLAFAYAMINTGAPTEEREVLLRNIKLC